MSTILKTLRKLEQDKKRVERKVDLKRLVVHEDSRKHRMESPVRPGRWWMGLLFVSVGILLGAGVVALIQKPDALMTARVEKNATQSSAAASRLPSSPPPSNSDRVSPAQNGLHGVSLASIPDLNPEPEMIEDPGIVEEYLPEELPVEISPAATPPVKTGVEPEPKREEDAGSQIVSAISAIPQQKRTRFTPQVPEEREVILREVPGLIIKGIIFFGDKNPDNYIFISVDGGPIQKLKAGESVSGAYLKDIQPGLVTFDWQENTVFQKVGSS